MIRLQGQARWARIYANEGDSFRGLPIREVALDLAREMQVAGVTIVVGSEGFGVSTAMHRSSSKDPARGRPIVVEAIDDSERLDPFLRKLQSVLDQSGSGGVIIAQDVQVVHHKPDGD